VLNVPAVPVFWDILTMGFSNCLDRRLLKNRSESDPSARVNSIKAATSEQSRQEIMSALPVSIDRLMDNTVDMQQLKPQASHARTKGT
jgi:hypothetical protein